MKIPVLRLLGLLLIGCAYAHAQDAESVLHNFCKQQFCPDGENPAGSPAQDGNGNFFGTTAGGGSTYEYGTVYELTSSGTFTTLYSFCAASEDSSSCVDGAHPELNLQLSADGNFYGVTAGTNLNDALPGNPTFFRITPQGSLTTLYTFCTDFENGICPDGSIFNSFIKGSDGNLYGTTADGGKKNQGTIFKMTTAGVRTTLYSFCSQGGTACLDGSDPQGVVIGSDGNIYGTSYSGGAYDSGTFFSLTPAGALTTLYFFCSQGGSDCTDGSGPMGEIAQSSDGKFYGATSGSVPSSFGGFVTPTIFSITSSGSLTTTTLGQVEYFSPSTLFLGSNGYLYGLDGGDSESLPDDFGFVYQIAPNGQFSKLYQFCSQQSCNGYVPTGIIQGEDGNLYGVTALGGIYNNDPENEDGDGAFFKITLNKLASTATVAASPNPVSAGQSLTITATVTTAKPAPTGSVEFLVNGSPIATGKLNSSGMATLVANTNGITSGSYSVTARYAGDLYHNGSQSSALDVLLNKAFTATIVTASPNPVTPPAGETLAATVTRSASGASGTASGTVTFRTGSTTLGTAKLNSSGVAVLKASTTGIPAGEYSVIAAYNGDSYDSTSTSSAVTVTAQ